MASRVENLSSRAGLIFDKAIAAADERAPRLKTTDAEWDKWRQYKALQPILRQPDPLPMLLEAASYSQKTSSRSGEFEAELVAGGVAATALAIISLPAFLVGTIFFLATSCGNEGTDSFEVADIRGFDLAADVYVATDSFEWADSIPKMDTEYFETEVQAADNTVDQVPDIVPDQVYDPAYKDCFLFPPSFPRTPEPEELMEVLKYDGEEFNNFYKEIHIYYPPELLNYEIDALVESINKAAEFTQLFTSKYYKMPPRYEVLEIYFRFNDGFDYAGQANGNQIWLSRLDFEKSLSTGDTHALSNTAVHEMMHTYVQPSLTEDANHICNEGNAEIAQHAFWVYSDLPKYQYGYGLFPDEPVAPLFAAQFKDGLIEYFNDNNGIQHKLEMKALEEGVLVIIDGKANFAAPGSCEIMNVDKFFICNDLKNETENTLVFNTSDIVMDDIADMPFEKNGSKYLTIYHTKTVWGLDINGDPELFRPEFKAFSSAPFYFSQDASYEKSTLEYRAAYGMLLLLQQMYRKEHPADHPNHFLSIIGGAYNDYVKENCENGYQLPTTNIYHRLCEGMAVDTDECLGIFESFGLDVDWFLK